MEFRQTMRHQGAHFCRREPKFARRTTFATAAHNGVNRVRLSCVAHFLFIAGIKSRLSLLRLILRFEDETSSYGGVARAAEPDLGLSAA
jgi:hypothetical protein